MTGRGWPVALTIAGSDPSGGAGLQGDLKTFAALEVYGAAAITAITVQNTRGVEDVHLLPPALVGRQVETVLDDLPVAAVKIGMLGDRPQVQAVVEALSRRPDIPVVLDPIMRASGGESLLAEEGLEILLKRLLPLAHVVTPNLPEARVLAGGREAPPAELAQLILARGARAVLVTGGHGTGDSVEDLLVTRTGRRRFSRPRLDTTSTHGTGCALAAAVAAGLARGMTLEDGVSMAWDYVGKALETAWPLGHGRGPLHHMYPFWSERA
ncbi:MAG: bifunctional hydroxymethylpyrimidine kinase/phosphomethylpyrimidine kinase [Acidobacteria bacterium]|nr:bifunctional hydroxymethylpyrimidine kinase/phosphomethylpyrimidine kinase [Acidobacteriota bacterium]